MRRRLWLGALAAVLAGTGTLLLIHPQLRVLASEGFPAAEWPANGRFVVVEGSKGSDPERPGTPLPPAALARFDEAEGRALVVAGPGGLVLEHYAPGTSRETRLNSFSLVKSLVGALILRAVADGLIDLDRPIVDYVPLPPRDGAPVAGATVREVLAMRTGLALAPEPAKAMSGVDDKSLDDAAFSPFGALARVHAFGPDLLAERLIDPGPEARGEFRYQSANTALLGMALERAYGRPLPELLSDLIWRPAGAAEAHWRAYPRDGRATAYCCLYARPLDWALVGLFLARNGTADDPFLPPALWREFIVPELGEDRRSGVYGWHIRHDVLDRDGEALQGPFAFLMGYGGQIVYLLPDPAEPRVVVRFGAEPQLLHSTLYELDEMLGGAVPDG